MPRRVVDLYACWWTVGSTRSVVAWKMVSLCLFGVYGGKLMIEVLSIVREHWKSLSLFSSILCIFGQ